MLLKKVLLVTYHFPPSAASGAFRLLGFARHLPTFGWQPIVAAPRCLPWEPIDPQLVELVPDEAIVEPVPYPIGAPRLLRAVAQNAIWLPRAWRACKRLIEAHRPDAILTSGPPHCVHVLGHYLRRRTGLPWVADFRDPWITSGRTRKLGFFERWALRWERSVFAHADLVLANAPNACRLFQETYPVSAAKIVTLTNGFDPGDVVSSPIDRTRQAPIRLVHAGEIYAGRDPAPLLEAMAELNARSVAYDLHVLGRQEIDLDRVLRERGWTDFVFVQGQRTYRETQEEMARADILVLLDSPGRTIGVPAKLYEYFGAGRPILALAEPDGDVAAVLRQSGVLHRIASPGNPAHIRQALCELDESRNRADTACDRARLHSFTRERITQTLAHRLDALIGLPSDALWCANPVEEVAS
jgi:glycosyltransferase involved in cell wall biosynthesis